MADFLTLCQRFRQEIGEIGTGPAAVTGQTGLLKKIIDWIAESDYSIQTLWADWDYLWSQYQVDTIAGTASYPGPSDVKRWDLESFYLDYNTNTSSRLSYVPYKEWRTRYRQGVKTNSKPSRFTVTPDNSFILDHPPDAVYSVTADYWARPTRLANNTDVSAIPEEFHRLIILRAKLLYAEEEEFPDLYQRALAEYQDLMSKLESDQLPGQENRARSEGEYLTVRPE